MRREDFPILVPHAVVQPITPAKGNLNRQPPIPQRGTPEYFYIEFATGKHWDDLMRYLSGLNHLLVYCTSRELSGNLKLDKQTRDMVYHFLAGTLFHVKDYFNPQNPQEEVLHGQHDHVRIEMGTDYYGTVHTVVAGLLYMNKLDPKERPYVVHKAHETHAFIEEGGVKWISTHEVLGKERLTSDKSRKSYIDITRPTFEELQLLGMPQHELNPLDEH